MKGMVEFVILLALLLVVVVIAVVLYMGGTVGDGIDLITNTTVHAARGMYETMRNVSI